MGSDGNALLYRCSQISAVNGAGVLHAAADDAALGAQGTQAGCGSVRLAGPRPSRSRWLDYAEIRQKMSSSGHSSGSVKLSSGKTNSVPWAIRAATSYKSSLRL